jgi:hypothetical protein
VGGDRAAGEGEPDEPYGATRGATRRRAGRARHRGDGRADEHASLAQGAGPGGASRGPSTASCANSADGIESLAAHVLLVLILEDLHWADYSTLDCSRRSPAAAGRRGCS